METGNHSKNGASLKNRVTLLIFILFLLGISSVYAQDVITLRNGDEIKAKVTEITSSEIRYKRFENLDGPTVVVPRAEVFAINYENGTREVINSATSTAQAARTASQSSAGSHGENSFGIYVNPIGFATFGPMVGVELTKGHFIGEFNLRFVSLGLLMPIFVESAESMDSGIGVGVGLKYFHPGNKGGFYAGGFFEYWTANYQLPNEVAVSNGILIGSNVGYKFIFNSGVYVRTGGYLCVSRTIEYKSSYETTKGATVLGGLLDLAIGIKF